MKNTIRCCISCILPCGSLDVIRIVHSNGRLEETRGTIQAAELMKSHPKHVLKTPTLTPSSDGVRREIVIVPPDTELQRGKIYFLMPVTSSPAKTKFMSSTRKKRRAIRNNSNNLMMNRFVSDQYLREIISEKLPTQSDRRRGCGSVWRPRLESICETITEV